MDWCECGAPLAFSPDRVHCLGCCEHRVPSGDVVLWQAGRIGEVR